jgi:hypothetical protein
LFYPFSGENLFRAEKSAHTPSSLLRRDKNFLLEELNFSCRVGSHRGDLSQTLHVT